MSNNYSNSFVIFASSIGFFYNTAEKFKDDTIFLNKKSDNCTPSFHLLSSLVVELLPKVLIALDVCLKYKNKQNQEISQDDLIKEISKEMNKFGHNLEKLYKNFPDLMSYLNIKDIEEYPPKAVISRRDYFVWQYNFTFIDYINPVMIKNIEAIRYGSFANKPDVATICIDDDKIIDFLEKLDNYVIQKKAETREILLSSL